MYKPTQKSINCEPIKKLKMKCPANYKFLQLIKVKRVQKKFT